MRQFMRDDRLGFTRSRDGLRAQHDRRAQHAPADRRTQLLAHQKRGAMLEPHAPLRLGERRQPRTFDQYFGAPAHREQPHDRQRHHSAQQDERDKIEKGGKVAPVDNDRRRSGPIHHDRDWGRGDGRIDRRPPGCLCFEGERGWRREPVRGKRRPLRQQQDRGGQREQRGKPCMRDHRPLARRTRPREAEQRQRQCRNDGGFPGEAQQHGGGQHHPLPSRALAIIFSSSSSSSPVISSCIPSSAAAALVADPLKKTRTTWLSADLRAVLSDTLGA